MIVCGANSDYVETGRTGLFGAATAVSRKRHDQQRRDPNSTGEEKIGIVNDCAIPEGTVGTDQ